MNIVIGLTALAAISLVGCKTTNSDNSKLRGEVTQPESKNIGFETDPSYIDRDTIILTFDDGVDLNHTPRVLDALKAEGVKASFFINATSNGNLQDPAMQNVLKRIVDEGHEVGNHTAQHLSLPSLSAEQLDREITIVDNLSRQIIGRQLTLLRAPFGEPFQSPRDQESYQRVLKGVAKHGVHIGWNLDSDDWRCTGPGCVTRQVKGLIDSGRYGIILFHSTNAFTANEIAGIIQYMKARGKRFGLVEDAVYRKTGRTSAEWVGATNTVVTRPGGNVPCSGAEWTAGRNYNVGDIVTYQGQSFTAVHANPGYDPKISTWFWRAGDLCTTGSTPILPPTPTGSVTPDVGRTYTLTAKHSSKCLDVTGNWTTDLAPLQQWPCLPNKPNQQFTLKDAGNGYRNLIAKHSGKCVEVVANGTANRTAVQQKTCNGTNDQKVKVTAGHDGAFQLRFESSDKCMDLYNSNRDDGAKVSIWECVNSADNQVWYFKPAP